MQNYTTSVTDMSVISNRLDGIVNEMENTLLRAGRSAVLNMARDFSCSIITGDNQLLSSGAGLPVHIIGGERLGESLARIHPDLKPGDAFLHNNPYEGNTHAADHTLMVPVFVNGEHMFTTLAKAHQADIGNSVPTTYMPFAKDVYEEGALVFTATQVQRDFTDIDDIITMCRNRIRVPDQWYGDYLAMVGAARIGERALQELVDKYGMQTIKDFISDYFNYSENMMKDVIAQMPAGHAVGQGFHDPVGDLVPDSSNGVPVNVAVTVSPEEGRITVDLRDNIDCVDGGVNSSETCSVNNAMTGVLNCLDPSVPRNAGSFRCLDVLLRDGCLVGRPSFPHSTSVGTTNVGERLVMTTQRTIAENWPGFGIAEGASGCGPGFAVISGDDDRHGDKKSYVNQIFLASQGGPGRPGYDGWVTFSLSVANGLMFHDSIEVDEQKYPMLVQRLEIRPDSAGAGQWRGAPGTVCEFGPVSGRMSTYYVTDGAVNPPRGVSEGHDGARSEPYIVRSDGSRRSAVLIGDETLETGELLGQRLAGGGGYGHPFQRDMEEVRKDVLRGFTTVDAAREVYGVVFTSDRIDEDLRIDEDRTCETRTGRKARRTTLSRNESVPVTR